MISGISIIAAIGRNRELGKGNELIWRIPDDLKRFKQLTSGHPIIMGRKTFESIGRPLPGRTNIVITRDEHYGENYKGPSLIISASVEDALAQAKRAPGAEEIFVIGGGQIYAEALSHASKLYLTRIEAAADADSFFPPFEHAFTNVITEEEREHEGLRYRWIDSER